MVSVSPFYDKKTFSLCMDRPSKKTIYLALTNQSLLNFQPTRLSVLVELSTIQVVSTYSDFNPSDCVLCVEPHKPFWYTDIHS